MKAGAKRRRTKQDIIDEKRAQQKKQNDIEVKLLRIGHIEEAYEKQQAQLMEYKVSSDNLTFHMKELHKQGLIKQLNNGQLSHVESFEEAEALRLQIAEDQRIAEEMQSQMQQTPVGGPDASRMRASLQLEETTPNAINQSGTSDPGGG